MSDSDNAARPVELRFPAATVPAEYFAAFADAADHHGDGTVQLTRRGQLQIPTSDPDGVVEMLLAAGAWSAHPQRAHVRTVVSPLSGRSGGRLDMGELARLFCQQCPQLGAVLVGFDDGRGDILAEGPELGLLACDGSEVELIINGRPAGVVVSRDAAVPALVELAQVLADAGGDLAAIAEVHQVLRTPYRRGSAGAPQQAPTAPVGWFGQPDGRVSLGAGLVNGVLSSQQARMLAQTRTSVIITAWHGLVLVDLDEAVADVIVRVLAPNGFVFDVNSALLSAHPS
ncbi:hypothetical protein KRX51_06065 [Corynebacterium sp. TAE3-ERU12]|uniref:hypothetical protein n=1 Tax=Corynebacterium sp. TAE3-ERU12 TaxID=2849491 RepID=UPI001C4400B4|nr:hypothetical protein [Corynebacterium sp. TAE3-ERU12]MBV7295484.1 hypothetical protein [Corynebacterium sp. TAE3-ERU12]